MRATPLSGVLPGHRAFITGGGSGLGLALATWLARDGWTLGLLDREASRLAPAAAALSAAGAAAVHCYGADVTDEAGFGAAVDAFATAAGGLDLMVNNAGVVVAGGLDQTPASDWRWVLDVNVVGVAIGCRAALPHLKRGGNGLVLNIASAASFATAAEMGAYNASKAAVVAITETLSIELDGSGVRATVAMPGFFQTQLLQTMRAPAGAIAMARRFMERSGHGADEIAADLLAACAAGRLHVVLPSSYLRLWRWKRWLPGHFLGWMARQRRMALARRAQRGGGSTERT